MEIPRKLRSRFVESKFSWQNREWTRAGKRRRHNCTSARNWVNPETVEQKPTVVGEVVGRCVCICVCDDYPLVNRAFLFRGFRVR